jgi:hypothetical protein
MSPGWQPSTKAVAPCEATDRLTIDQKVETEVPSEARRSIDDDMARREVVIGPEIPRRGSSLRDSGTENCAPENQHHKNIPREAVF